MLVLRRRSGEGFYAGEICVDILSLEGGQVKIGISVPAESADKKSHPPVGDEKKEGKAMLVIQRKPGEGFHAGETWVDILVLEGHRVKIGISAPEDIVLVRKELLHTTKGENRDRESKPLHRSQKTDHRSRRASRRTSPRW